MGRKKGTLGEGLPDNLYPTKSRGSVSYVYQHPHTLKKKSLGTNREKAVKQAHMLNQAIAAAGIVERQPYTPSAKKLKKVAGDFLKWKLPKLKKGGSRINQKNFVNRIVSEFGNHNIEHIKTGNLYAWMDPLPDAMYIKIHTILNELFTFAISTGVMSGVNPVDNLLKKKEPKRKRRRLKKADYKRIYELATPELQRTMSLMIYTTLRPNDAVKLKKSAFVDGVLYVKTNKTGVIIEYELPQTAIDEIITASNKTEIASPYLIHYLPKRLASRENWPSWRKHHTQVSAEMVSREFSNLRDLLRIDWDYPARERPALYECRSAGGRWQKEMGVDKKRLQALYGHTDEDTTDLYLEDEQATKRFRVQCAQVEF